MRVYDRADDFPRRYGLLEGRLELSVQGIKNVYEIWQYDRPPCNDSSYRAFLADHLGGFASYNLLDGLSAMTLVWNEYVRQLMMNLLASGAA